MIRTLSIEFGGSFQCRLAVGMDSTNSSPTDPYGTYGKKSAASGGTFAYAEAPFDRILRLSNPVAPRAAAVDAWEDCRVKEVRVGSALAGLKPIMASPWMGAIVSLGPSTKFEEEDYNIIDFAIGIGPGGSLLQALATNKPSMTDAVDASMDTFHEYQTKKAALIRDQTIDPVRLRCLSDTDLDLIGGYAGIFRRSVEYYASFVPANTRILAPFDAAGFGKMDAPSNYDWTLVLTFQRWDGDALTGRVSGTIVAIHQAILVGLRDALLEVVAPVFRRIAPYLAK